MKLQHTTAMEAFFAMFMFCFSFMMMVAASPTYNYTFLFSHKVCSRVMQSCTLFPTRATRNPPTHFPL
jgi:hypothetical protein